MGADLAGVDRALRQPLLGAVEAVLSSASTPESNSRGPGLGFAGGVAASGLVWGFDFVDGQALTIIDLQSHRSPQVGLRWLHFNAADRGTQRWIEAAGFPAPVRDLLLSHDDHQRALIANGHVACALHDFEREFDNRNAEIVGTLRFVIAEGLMLTVRRHPLRCADIAKSRIVAGSCPTNAAAALDLLSASIAEVMSEALHDLESVAEHVEDELLADKLTPDTRKLVALRRRSVQLHRLLAGLGAVCHRLENDEQLPPALLPAISKFTQRVTALDRSVSALQSQLQLLRDEFDLQVGQQTNRSLYGLSILSALMLPATLVTGLFGMNTGGLPWAHSSLGTLAAALTAACSALAVYLLLRLLGFVKF